MMFRSSTAAQRSAASRSSTSAGSRGGAHAGHPLALGPFGGVADLEDLHRRLRLLHEIVHAHDRAPALLHLALEAHRRAGDLALEPAALDRLHHAALRLDLGEQLLGLALELRR